MAFSKSREEIVGYRIEVLYPLHEIDSYNGEELKNYIMSVSDSVDVVIINFSRITYLNSSGLRELIQILKHLKEGDKQLFFTKINDDIKKIFVHTNLDRLFKIFPGNEDVKSVLTA